MFGRGHRPVCVLVMLVDAHAVEAEPLGGDQLLEVLVVEPVPDLRVVVAVGQRHPGGLDLLPRRDVRVGHEMEGVEVELVHRALSLLG